jgi:hypothetical protein
MFLEGRRGVIRNQVKGERPIVAVNISARERGSSPRFGARATIGRSPFLLGPVNDPGDREEERARV